MAEVLTNDAFNYFLTISLVMVVPIFLIVAMVSFFRD